MKRRLTFRPFLFALLLISPLVYGACPKDPATAYEQLYCDIQAKGGGSTLPSFEDFRRNSPQVQALLLKRPAARLGLSVPGPEAATSQSAKPSPPGTSERPKTEPESGPTPPPAVASAFEGCQLGGTVIRCPSARYELATNQANSALRAGVLDDDNRLGLSAYRGDLSDETAVRAYLSDAYDRYIAKMLEIGLGGTTMSFTRFYNSFRRHEAKGIDFAQRMDETFDYLKQDKRTLGVNRKPPDELPKSLKNCAPSGARVIVCDNVATNWVYVRD
ncbi:hypothetical protein EZI54_04490 [Marinobacter halodurans]|uniref:Uncharacterized protein n=1 Tax=Marinobacter halodurans TaxID=2528979 RepID=A0ABY1ZS79_9GAMM|nr:hypothetical protein [Marinobacter halodurans]TBW58120.1 hypothetical protein EZI54_04490 [Marinobacter halodurans]